LHSREMPRCICESDLGEELARDFVPHQRNLDRMRFRGDRPRRGGDAGDAKRRVGDVKRRAEGA
jgi:hypothetical protein